MHLVHSVFALCQVSGRKWAGSGTRSCDLTTDEERGDPGSNGGSGETETKRARVDGSVRVDMFTPRAASARQAVVFMMNNILISHVFIRHMIHL